MSYVSIMFACNDPDNGNFTGRFDKVEIGQEILSLDNKYWPPVGPRLTYNFKVLGPQTFAAMRATGTIKVSHRRFPIIGFKSWYGNWCWDVVIVTPETAIDLINYLKHLDKFQVEAGETQWFEAFQKDGFEFDKDPGGHWMKTLNEFGYSRP